LLNTHTIAVIEVESLVADASRLPLSLVFLPRNLGMAPMLGNRIDNVSILADPVELFIVYF